MEGHTAIGTAIGTAIATKALHPTRSIFIGWGSSLIQSSPCASVLDRAQVRKADPYDAEQETGAQST